VAAAPLTPTSVILGTAAYLSPEQVATGDAGPRSDVYAVGVLAYELLTGATPFTGDSALAVAYQRMDNDVAPPGTVIAGVPSQFDELVLRATARDPARRYADATDMRAELDAIVDELGLPDFRVPAPRNSAQHLSAALHRSQQHARTDTTARQPAAPSPRQRTRELTRDDWQPVALDDDHEYQGVSGQFAGIDLNEFYWARQRAKRVLLFWVVAVLTLTGLIAAAAWTLGSNIDALI
jgi:serine/threonine protein kinase, bacterial